MYLEGRQNLQVPHGHSNKQIFMINGDANIAEFRQVNRDFSAKTAPLFYFCFWENSYF